MTDSKLLFDYIKNKLDYNIKRLKQVEIHRSGTGVTVTFLHLKNEKIIEHSLFIWIINLIDFSYSKK
jgi:hypothetical protein